MQLIRICNSDRVAFEIAENMVGVYHMYMADLRTLIKNTGLKATPSRLAVLKLFDCECSPLTVENVLRELKGVKKKPDRATIYRILENFVKTNLLKEVYFNDGIIRYESALGDHSHHHHHHAVCVSCGTTKEVEDDGMEKVLDKVSKKIKGFTLSDHALEFFGTCDKCLKIGK